MIPNFFPGDLIQQVTFGRVNVYHNREHVHIMHENDVAIVLKVYVNVAALVLVNGIVGVVPLAQFKPIQAKA